MWCPWLQVTCSPLQRKRKTSLQNKTTVAKTLTNLRGVNNLHSPTRRLYFLSFEWRFKNAPHTFRVSVTMNAHKQIHVTQQIQKRTTNMSFDLWPINIFYLGSGQTPITIRAETNALLDRSENIETVL